jgi:hypothetical protein
MVVRSGHTAELGGFSHGVDVLMNQPLTYHVAVGVAGSTGGGDQPLSV